MEEEELLQEEMCRVVVYLEWKSCMWSERVGIRADSCTPDIQHSVDAYARKQAHIHRRIAVSFASQWLPYLNTCGYETIWLTDLSCASEVLSHKTKLPRWFPTIPANTSHIPPTADLSLPGPTAGPQMVQERPDTHTVQTEDSGYREYKCGERSTENDEGSDDEEGTSDNEYKGYGYVGYGDGGCDDNDYDEERYDGEGCDNELGFEYDDEYMS